MKKFINKLFLVLLLVISTVTIVGCKDNKPTPPTPPTPTPDVTIAIGEAPGNIKKGETVKLTVEITGTEDKAFTWEISDDKILAIDGENTVSVIADITVDKIVTVTAIAHADETKKASKTFKVIAPVIEGQVGELTSEMLKEISTSNLTVTGVITDYYTDFRQSTNSTINEYDMTVKMEENMWYGAWNSKEFPTNVVKDYYQMGKEDGVKDQYGNSGHNLEKLFINKNNESSSKTVVDNMGIPSVWEAQHLWNHLGNLQINKFQYIAEDNVYEYKIDEANVDELYLMTYLSFSLTPLLEDTLLKFYLVVEDGEITGIKGQTEIIYYGPNDKEDPDAMSYTTIDLQLTDLNSTSIEKPAPFKEPEHADALKKAIEIMKTAENYTFHTVDTLLFSPSGNEDEYVPQTKMNARRANDNKIPMDSISSRGTVGCYGTITKEAALYATTDKYQYSMDGRDYYTVHTGVKQNDDNTYDEFKFNSTNLGYEGTKRVIGNFHNDLPKFDFSPALFEFVGATINKHGKSVYTFELQETGITKDIAMEMSNYRYADDATSSTYRSTQITVDEDGNLISTQYPYSFGGGNYVGFTKTTFKDFGTTKLHENLFDNYVPRKQKNNWEDYITKYYSPNFQTPTHDEQTSVVLEAVFGEDKKDIPQPKVFMDLIGDNIFGPFYEWKSKGQDENGNEKYYGYIAINIRCDDLDENDKIRDYDGLMNKFKEALGKEGFTLSKANTDTTGGDTGRSDRIVCFIKNNIQIVIEDNHTRYLTINFYKTGDWTLKK